MIIVTGQTTSNKVDNIGPNVQFNAIKPRWHLTRAAAVWNKYRGRKQAVHGQREKAHVPAYEWYICMIPGSGWGTAQLIREVHVEETEFARCATGG